MKHQILTAVSTQKPTSEVPLKEKIIKGLMVFYMRYLFIVPFFKRIWGILRRKKRTVSYDESGHVVIRADEGEWKQIYPGVSIKVLYVDIQQGISTLLTRMDPGSLFPSHIHKGVEQAFLINGDALSGDISLKSHDYLIANAFSYHSPITTQNGCLILLITPDIEILSVVN